MRVLFVLFLIFPVFTMSADTIADYYPFAIGNYWIQHSEISNGGIDPLTFSMEIEAIDPIGGVNYFRRINWLAWDNGSDEAIWYTWLRFSDEGVILGAFGETTNINDATIFDPAVLWFPNELATLGYTYEVEIPEMGGTFSFANNGVGASVNVPAGSFDNCIVILLTITDSTNTLTQNSEFYFAHNVGEVRNYSWNQWYEYSELELTEYEVNVSSPQNNLPVPFSNLINYPNPFNPSTTISFEIVAKDAKDAKIKIYNLKGQKVKTISVFPSPNHTVSIVWDGTDDSGIPVSSDVYFCRLKIGEFSASRKMLLLK